MSHSTTVIVVLVVLVVVVVVFVVVSVVAIVLVVVLKPNKHGPVSNIGDFSLGQRTSIQ